MNPKLQQRLPWAILGLVLVVLLGWWATSATGILDSQTGENATVSSSGEEQEDTEQGRSAPDEGGGPPSSSRSETESPSPQETRGIQQGLATEYVHREDQEQGTGPLVVEGLNAQRRSTEEVALLAASVMTTWAPAEDLNQTEAEKRARGLMTDQRAGEVAGPQRPASGELWRQAATEDATSVPMVEINEATEVQEGTTSVIATWSWSDPDGTIIASDPTRRIFYFQIKDTKSGPKISDYTWEDAAEVRR